MKLILRKKRNTLYYYCRFRYAEIWIPTGVRIASEQWDENTGYFKKKCENNCENTYSKVLNKKKADIEQAFYRLIAKEKPVTSESLRTEIDGVPFLKKRISNQSTSLSEEFKEYLRLREHSVAHHTLKKLNQLTEKLVRFEDTRSTKLTKDSFNRTTFQEFTQFLSREEKLADNTIAAHVYALKGFLKFVNPDVNYDYIKFSEKYYNVFYLEPEEVLVLKNATGLLPYLEKTRDVFLIAYYSGVRYSDLKQIRLDNLYGGVFKIMMEKTNTYCYPPLMPELEVLLKKYNGECPDTSNQKLNDYLKILFRELKLTRRLVKMTKKGPDILKEPMELCDVVTMHVARKTFIMTLVAKGYQRDDIIHMTGHLDTKALDPYTAILESRVKQINNQLRLGGVL
jgi:site-specific recombinase XerD